MDLELFKVKRPLYNHEFDNMHMPIVKKDIFSIEEFENIKVTNLPNFRWSVLKSFLIMVLVL